MQAVMRGEGEAPPILVARCLPEEARDALYAYMLELVDATPTGTTAVYYADFMRLNARVRRARKHLQEADDVGVGGTLDQSIAAMERAVELARIALEVQGGYLDFAEAVRHAEEEIAAVASGQRMVSSTIPKCKKT